MKHRPAKASWPALRMRIEARCDEVGDCLIYRSRQRRPTVTFKCRGKWRNGELRRMYWVIQGQALPDGMCVTSSCGDSKCVAHLVLRTLSQAQHAAGKRMAYSDPAKAAKISATRRKSSKYSDELITQIVSSAEPARVWCERTGISQGYVYAIRRGAWRKPLANSNPWAGLFGGSQR